MVTLHTDEGYEVVEVSVNPGDSANEVTVHSEEGFLPGESYCLILTTEIQSADGSNLTSAVRMNFQVE